MPDPLQDLIERNLSDRDFARLIIYEYHTLQREIRWLESQLQDLRRPRGHVWPDGRSATWDGTNLHVK